MTAVSGDSAKDPIFVDGLKSEGTGNSITPSTDDLGHRPELQSANLLAAYAVLFQQRTLDNDVLWRIIAFAFATEAGGLIALFSNKLASVNPNLIILIGAGLLVIGVVGPLTVRFVETAAMLNRQLLDQYEDLILQNWPDLRQFHGSLLSKRFVQIRGHLRPDRQEALDRRRIATNDSGRALRALDRFADLLGQPSKVWTAVTAAGGTVGFGVALSAAGVTEPTRSILTSTAAILTFSLWMIAIETHKLPRRIWRRIRRKTHLVSVGDSKRAG